MKYNSSPNEMPNVSLTGITMTKSYNFFFLLRSYFKKTTDRLVEAKLEGNPVVNFTEECVCFCLFGNCNLRKHLYTGTAAAKCFSCSGGSLLLGHNYRALCTQDSYNNLHFEGN